MFYEKGQSAKSLLPKLTNQHQMKRILIINGPNLNLLGQREQAVYGSTSFQDYLQQLRNRYAQQLEILYFQSNIEGLLIDALHNAALGKQVDAVVLNAGGYTHTSVSLADAVRAVGQMGLPCIEVHISNLAAREPFRHTSLISPACQGSIMGFGLDSYQIALAYLLQSEAR